MVTRLRSGQWRIQAFFLVARKAPPPGMIFFIIRWVTSLVASTSPSPFNLWFLETPLWPTLDTSLRVPYYAPSPCHMHPVHNCHHIQSCHPPVKQYIMTHHNTEFIMYTCPVHYFSFVIPNYQGQGQGPRCGMVCEYTVYWSVPSSGYLPWSFPPSLAPLLPIFLAQSFIRSLLPPSFPRAVHAWFRPFLACSLHQPSLPQPSFLHRRSLHA